MKLKLNGNYITNTVYSDDGILISDLPVVFDTAEYVYDTKTVNLYNGGKHILSFRGHEQTAYSLEGGTWSSVQQTQKEKEIADIDTLLVETLSGPITTETKARLFARQVHENKIAYPSDIPEDIRSYVYDAYTEHYKYLPELSVITVLEEAYTVDDETMHIREYSMFPLTGYVTIADTEHSTVIEYGDRKDGELHFCRCVDGMKGITYNAGSLVELRR